MNLGYLISLCGLLFDIEGGWLLARSIYSRRPNDIYIEAGTYWSSNEFVFKSGIIASIDSKFAVPFLILGFLGQFFGGYLESQRGTPNMNLIVCIVFFIVTLILIGLSLFIISKRKKWWTKHIDLFYEAYNAENDAKQNPPVIDESILQKAKEFLGKSSNSKSPGDIIAEYVSQLRKTIQVKDKLEI